MVHRILLVEDEAELAELLGEVLTERGDEVRIAHSLGAALETLRDFHPCVVMSDLTLPDADREVVVPRLREHAGGVPIYLMSAVDARELEGLGQREGVRGVLPKPFDLDDFERLVREGCADADAARGLPG